jgi:pyruvate formate lyase activating enzyme
MSADAILAEVERDQAFHRRSGGGVTFSGGEATCQPRLLGALAERLARMGTHLVLETCGFFDWSDNEAALARMDLVYFDLKHMDSRVHERLTGVGNDLILANAARIAAGGTPMVVRLPLIPGLNDSEENLAETARFVAERLGRAVPMEVLPYHRLGSGKYAALGEAAPLAAVTPPTTEAVQQAADLLGAGGGQAMP